MKQRIQAAIAKKLKRWLDQHDREQERRRLSQFKTTPKNLVFDKPYRLVNPQLMEMGDDVYFGPNASVACNLEYPSDVLNPPEGTEKQTFNPTLSIGNRVSSTGGLQLSAREKIVIEDDVLFATNVHMTDAFHGYENVDLPYKFQPMWKMAPIVIKRGAWIGQNAVIAPGVTVGEMSIIGANSVVNQDIPPYCIAVGAPAKVIKKWDPDSAAWRSA